MKSWYLARKAVRCGGCDDGIAAGQPVFELSGIGWAVRRCGRCASRQGEAQPEHLTEQPTVSHTVRTNFSERIASVRGLASDWKHAQGGDRD